LLFDCFFSNLTGSLLSVCYPLALGAEIWYINSQLLALHKSFCGVQFLHYYWWNFSVAIFGDNHFKLWGLLVTDFLDHGCWTISVVGWVGVPLLLGFTSPYFLDILALSECWIGCMFPVIESVLVKVYVWLWKSFYY